MVIKEFSDPPCQIVVLSPSFHKGSYPYPGGKNTARIGLKDLNSLCCFSAPLPALESTLEFQCYVLYSYLFSTRSGCLWQYTPGLWVSNLKASAACKATINWICFAFLLLTCLLLQGCGPELYDKEEQPHPISALERNLSKREVSHRPLNIQAKASPITA